MAKARCRAHWQLVPKKECVIGVKIGWVRGIITDGQGNVTPEIRFRSYLASVDNIPLIVGFKDLLEKFHVEFDVAREKAFIEMP